MKFNPLQAKENTFRRRIKFQFYVQKTGNFLKVLSTNGNLFLYTNSNVKRVPIRNLVNGFIYRNIQLSLGFYLPFGSRSRSFTVISRLDPLEGLSTF